MCSPEGNFHYPKRNEKVFEILEPKFTVGKKRTGRPGMDMWQIFVLSQVRLCQNISYEELHHISNYDSLIRQIMGVESGFGYEKYKFRYQNIIDNVSLWITKGKLPPNVELGKKLAITTYQYNLIVNYRVTFRRTG